MNTASLYNGALKYSVHLVCYLGDHLHILVEKVNCYINVPFKAFKWILLISEILWIWTGHRFVTYEDLYVINDVTPF